MLNRIKEWRQRRGQTLQQLASHVGTSKSQIDKLEKGERRLTVEWMIRLAKPLACDPRELLPTQGDEQATPSPLSEPVATLPVHGKVLSGGSDLCWTDDPVDQVIRPFFLAHALDAYALYGADEKMAPMFRTHQLLFVNPYKPPVPGCGIVVHLKDKRLLLRAFVRSGEGGPVVRTFFPTQSDTQIPVAEIAAIHAVVGTLDLP